MNKQERKRQAAIEHNKRYEKKSQVERSTPTFNYLMMNPPGNRASRNAMMDKTNSTGSKVGGKRLRDRAESRFEKIMNGRDKWNRLMERTGVVGVL